MPTRFCRVLGCNKRVSSRFAFHTTLPVLPLLRHLTAAAMLTVPDCVDEIGPSVQLPGKEKRVPPGSRQRGKVLVGAAEQGGDRRGLSALVAGFVSALRRGTAFRVVQVQKLINRQEKNGFVENAVIIHSFLFFSLLILQTYSERSFKYREPGSLPKVLNLRVSPASSATFSNLVKIYFLKCKKNLLQASTCGALSSIPMTANRKQNQPNFATTQGGTGAFTQPLSTQRQTKR